MAPDPLVVAHQVVKDYSALRPLRIEHLTVSASEIVSVIGLDAPGAETLVGLLTGAIVPDTGDVRLFGRSTKEVADSEAWLAMLDGVGILTDRAVLIGQFTVEQNIAMPFTLAVDPIAEEVRPQVEALAHEIGLEGGDLKAPVGTSSPEIQARVRLARALALNPTLLLAEHPSASLPRDRARVLCGEHQPHRAGPGDCGACDHGGRDFCRRPGRRRAAARGGHWRAAGATLVE